MLSSCISSRSCISTQLVYLDPAKHFTSETSKYASIRFLDAKHRSLMPTEVESVILSPPVSGELEEGGAPPHDCHCEGAQRPWQSQFLSSNYPISPPPLLTAKLVYSEPTREIRASS